MAPLLALSFAEALPRGGPARALAQAGPPLPLGGLASTAVRLGEGELSTSTTAARPSRNPSGGLCLERSRTRGAAAGRFIWA